LNDFGLAKAFQDLCAKFNKSTLRLNCEVEGLEHRLESYLELAIYRICQELLNNVVKHAQATTADILLVQEEGEITLKVRDNGIGYSQKPGHKKGIGLRTISDRVKLLNGTFSITTPAPGKGTLVVIRIPL
jgi:signal transduction histidine kinase